jgi:hypothetical protein
VTERYLLRFTRRQWRGEGLVCGVWRRWFRLAKSRCAKGQQQLTRAGNPASVSASFLVVIFSFNIRCLTKQATTSFWLQHVCHGRVTTDLKKIARRY